MSSKPPSTHCEFVVHSAVRRARDAGITLEEMEQVVALAASNIGFASAVAVWTWLRDETSRRGRELPRQNVD